MGFEEEFAAAVRRKAKQAQQDQAASFSDINRRRAAVLGHSSSYLRVKPVGYDMGPKNDPDGIFITLRD